MVKIICGACSKALSIDETKLPMKEVSFPCPLCKTKLSVDRRQIDLDSDEPMVAAVADGGGGAPPAQAPPAPAPPAVVPAPPAAAVAPSAAPAAPAARMSQSSGGARALIVGENTAELQQAARALGCAAVHRATVPEGRDYYLQEYPEIVLISPSTIAAPPMDDLVPLTSVGPAERRRGFFILVGDQLRSLDGNAAFLYGVNLVVGKKDLGAIGRIYEDARRDHDRLSRNFTREED